MTTAAAKTLNRSAHTLADLKRYAKSSDTGATTYLKAVEASLKAAGQKDAANAVDSLLADKTGTLVSRIGAHERALLGVFPTDEAGWQDVAQLQKAQELGWNAAAAPADPVARYVTGTIKQDPVNGASLVASNGVTYQLRDSTRLAGGPGLPPSYLVGMVGDGPLSLQGTVAEDGKTFNVEGFALNTDGKFDTFTFGRVSQTTPVVIESPRGDVEIADPALAKKLAALPRLGIILPGAPEQKADGSLVYRGNPDELFGLGRFRQTTATGTGDTRTVLTDMAYSVFSNKPVNIPAAQVDRVGHTSRMWVRGNVTMKGDEAVSFNASYLSLATDRGLYMGNSEGDADAVQSAVMTDAV